MDTSFPTAEELVSRYADNIKGKIILTTGVTPGSIGASYVKAVAGGSPALLILAGRSQEKLDKQAAVVRATNPAVPLRTLLIDLSSLESTRRAAATVNSWDDVPRIDVLCNSAAIMAWPYSVSPEGFENQLLTNHVTHFLLTNLIMEKLLKSDRPRVISVASSGHRFSPIRWGDMHFEVRTWHTYTHAHGGNFYNPWAAYGQSKTANMLFAISLAQKLGGRGLLSYSVHPGAIGTSNLAHHLDILDTWGTDDGDSKALADQNSIMGNEELRVSILNSSQGASTYVNVSFNPYIEGNNGAYFDQLSLPDPLSGNVAPWGTSASEAERLWRRTEEMVGQRFSY
ncbi:Short-chain dehydrogenase [Geosmithia morbida]|uniref:Short-chain dehydrogenase n=1 Tax=Geosmithia morbida TaxID=1094350 RepID=A0A9P4YTT7_9HYPO|nr:Short-chain dehydrogenase [Geosmithia morbida]KAF4121687.1 Short-chain dehydrogenase [Geosmithia morbida]